jgi:phosphoribosylformimino-5-aminoimidazole carboxamide ribotide isomerase
LKIIPVIDVLNGIAIHAIRGERKKYQPLRSMLCKSSDPLDIAVTFKALGFKSLYLADLDAIGGKSPNLYLYKQIVAKTSLKLIVDAGIADVAKAKKVLETGVAKIIIGTETLGDLDFLNQAVEAFGKNKIIVSMDLKEGKISSLSDAIKSMDVSSFAQKLVDIGISQIILLDLSRVGTEHGTNSVALEKILKKTGPDLFIGGGVKGIIELEELRQLGVSGALIATVLHNRKLKVDELKANGFLA